MCSCRLAPFLTPQTLSTLSLLRPPPAEPSARGGLTRVGLSSFSPADPAPSAASSPVAEKSLQQPPEASPILPLAGPLLLSESRDPALRRGSLTSRVNT